MSWWQNSDGVGTKTDIYAGASCDSAGYRVEPNSFWKKNISAILGAYSCNRARVSNIALTSAEVFIISDTSLGAYNDNVGLIQVYNG